MTVSGFGWRDLSTDAVPAADRLDYWREATGSLFPPTQLRRDGYEGFYGHVAWLSLGEVTIADIVSTRIDVVRSEREIHSGDDRWYELTIQIEGECAFSQDGRDIVTRPRSMVLYDSRRPYRMRFNGPHRQVSLKVPRAALRERVPAVDSMIALHLAADRIPGRFIYDLASGLCERTNEMPAALSGRLEQHVLDLMATALIGETPARAVPASRLTQLDRIKSYIIAHLDDAELTPRAIASAEGISLRRLYELFEAEEQQVARFVQAQRLDRIRRALDDPLLMALPINTLALRHGFKEFSHFSRAFRRQFGVAPGAYRAGTQA